MRITRGFVKKVNKSIKRYGDKEPPKNKGLLRFEYMDIDDERTSIFTLEMLRKVKLVKNTLHVMFKDIKIYNAIYIINLNRIQNIIFDPDCDKIVSGENIDEIEKRKQLVNGTQLFS